MIARDARGNDLGHDAVNFGWQRAAVGVAQHDPPRARLGGRPQAGQRIGGIGAVAVEKMLRIIQRLAPLSGDMGKTFGNRLPVFVERDAQGGGDVEFMALADQTHRRRVGVQNGGKDIIIGRTAPHPLGHAKSGHRGTGLWRGGEKLRVRRVRPRPAALDIIDAQGIQSHGDLAFLGGGELDTLSLLAIAEGGVEEMEAGQGHIAFLATKSFEEFSKFLRRNLIIESVLQAWQRQSSGQTRMSNLTNQFSRLHLLLSGDRVSDPPEKNSSLCALGPFASRNLPL